MTKLRDSDAEGVSMPSTAEAGSLRPVSAEVVGGSTSGSFSFNGEAGPCCEVEYDAVQGDLGRSISGSARLSEALYKTK